MHYDRFVHERGKLDPAWLCYGALAAGLLLLGVRSYFTFYADPPLWPDEAVFASPAIDLLHNGKFRLMVLEGLLPSAERGMYWMPPTYPFVLAGAFALFSVKLEVMRSFSLVCGLGVLLLTYGLARRLQLSRSLALLAPALLAIDPVFGRGARLGRMDIMGVLCVLAAVYVALDCKAPPRRRALLAGLLAGLGLSVHPLTSIALPIVFAAAIATDRPQRAPGAVAVGVVVGSLPWTLWIARDPLAFVVQWTAQLIRKSGNWEAYGDWPWVAAFKFTVTRYPPAVHGVVPWLHLAALVGFAFAAWRSREARFVFALYLVAWLAVMRGAEMWYAPYLTPLLALGLVAPLPHLLAQAPRVRAAGLTLACATYLSFAAFVARDAAEALRWQPAGLDYHAWSAKLVAALPRNSRVLLAATPDPYFATLSRPDLAVYEFLPTRIPMLEGSEQLRSELDFVVVGRFAPSPWVLQVLRERADKVTVIGQPDDPFYARVVALKH